MDLLQRAMNFASNAHEGTNHLYDGKPYFQTHVEGYVMKWGYRFIHLIPKEDQEDVLSALACHDVEEDCRKTYNDIKNATNERIANIVHALSNEKGKNRDERANDKYYNGILKEQYADFGKICDRLGNVEYGIEKGESMTKRYVKEYAHFKSKLYKKLEYAEMWHELDKMLVPAEMNNIQIGRIVRIVNENDVISSDLYVITQINTRFVESSTMMAYTSVKTFVDLSNLKDLNKKIENFDVEFLSKYK